MSLFPESGVDAPSGRIWDWLQSLTRTVETESNGVRVVRPKQVYIFPTRYGFLYCIMLIAMLFGSNNYGSNPGFLFTFLLTGLGLAALFQTWKNLVGLQLSSARSSPVFCGQPARFEVTVKNVDTVHKAGISCYPWKNKFFMSKAIDLPALEEGTLVINKPTASRGQMLLGKVCLTTRYPLGLLRSWVYIQFDESCLVYPSIGEVAEGFDYAQDNQSAKSSTKVDGDDFAGHKTYQDGDNVMHVDWKAVARGKGWNLKHFEDQKGEEIWLHWGATSGLEFEQRISALTKAVVQLEKAGKSYGLSIPGEKLQPSSGANHQHLCLKALALFQA